MKILVLGSGAREHALAVKFAQSNKVDEVIVSPGNGGIAREFKCVDLANFTAISEYVISNDIAMVFVGPEQPLAEGIVDYLQAKGIVAIGPSKLASQIESSKAFAKDLMKKYQVPTADYEVFTEYAQAKAYLNNCSYPVVFKADGLAAGKGVVIVNSQTEAEQELKEFMLDSKFGDAGAKLVIEEFLQGWETSIFAFCDGDNFVSTIFSMDHKQLEAGDKGPNTGGMGAIAPIIEAEKYKDEIDDNVFAPILLAMKEAGYPFTGVLYCGLMITSQGPKVIEFNCRFGDPETQVILPLLKTDLVDICEAITNKNVSNLNLSWKEQYAINIVCAAAGYPGKYKKGDVIEVADIDADSKVYYAGVKNYSGKLLTNGGRVLGITSLSNNREKLILKGYALVEKIFFEGKVIRRDIGQRSQR
jgi:phosphoribosylamine--glycine ligase